MKSPSLSSFFRWYVLGTPQGRVGLFFSLVSLVAGLLCASWPTLGALPPFSFGLGFFFWPLALFFPMIVMCRDQSLDRYHPAKPEAVDALSMTFMGVLPFLIGLGPDWFFRFDIALIAFGGVWIGVQGGPPKSLGAPLDLGGTGLIFVVVGIYFAKPEGLAAVGHLLLLSADPLSQAGMVCGYALILGAALKLAWLAFRALRSAGRSSP